MGYSLLSRQSNRVSTCYTACGTTLAFTQKDFLVVNIRLSVLSCTASSVGKNPLKYNLYLTQSGELYDIKGLFKVDWPSPLHVRDVVNIAL